MKKLFHIFLTALICSAGMRTTAQVSIDSVSANVVPIGGLLNIYVSGLNPLTNPNDIQIDAASNPIPGIGVVIKRNPGSSTAKMTSGGLYDYISIVTPQGIATSPDRISIVPGCNQPTDISSFIDRSILYANADAHTAQCITTGDIDDDGLLDIISGWKDCTEDCDDEDDDGYMRIDFGSGSSRIIPAHAVTDIQLADMNADGLHDIITIEEEIPADTTQPDTVYVNIYKVETASSWLGAPVVPTPVFQQGKSTPVTRSNISNNRLVPIDLDNDGYLDLVFASCDAAGVVTYGGSTLSPPLDPLNQLGEMRVWQLMLGQTGVFEFQETSASYLFNESDSIPESGDTSVVVEEIRTTIGDYDGDNKIDIGFFVAIKTRGTGADKNRAAMFTLSSSSCIEEECLDASSRACCKIKGWDGTIKGNLRGESMVSGDLDDDGYDEIITITETGFSLIHGNSITSGAMLIDDIDISTVALHGEATEQCAISDVNGDGKADLVFSVSSNDGSVSSEIIAWQNGSTTSGSISGSMSVIGEWSSSANSMQFTDFDRDARPDLIALRSPVSGETGDVIEKYMNDQQCNDVLPVCLGANTIQGNNLVINGNFNTLDFHQPYTPTAAYTPATFSASASTGTYAITGDVSSLSSAWCGNADLYGDETSMGLVVNARSSGKTSLWGQEVSISPSTTYTFSVFVNNPTCSGTNKPDPKIQLLVNGVAITTATTITETPDNWIQLSGVWVSNENPGSTATIEIVNTKSGANGNDIMIDDISFTGCYPELSVYAGDDVTICSGSSVQLNANVVSQNGTPYTVTWSPPNGLSSTTVVNPVCSSNKTRIYTVTATLSDGSSTSATDQVKVIVSPNPTANIYVSGALTVCNPACVALSTDNIAGVTYRWMLNGADAPGTNNLDTYSACSTGNYSVLVSNAAGCSKLSNSVYAQVITCKEGEENLFADNLTVYPNPTSDFVNLNYISDADAITNISIRNSAGVLLYEFISEVKTGLNSIEIDAQTFESGMYFVQLQNGNSFSVGKFVKM